MSMFHINKSNQLCCLKVLSMYDRLDAVDVEGVVRFVSSMQQEDGSFIGIPFLLNNIFFY